MAGQNATLIILISITILLLLSVFSKSKVPIRPTVIQNNSQELSRGLNKVRSKLTTSLEKHKQRRDLYFSIDIDKKLKHTCLIQIVPCADIIVT